MAAASTRGWGVPIAVADDERQFLRPAAPPHRDPSRSTTTTTTTATHRRVRRRHRDPPAAPPPYESAHESVDSPSAVVVGCGSGRVPSSSTTTAAAAPTFSSSPSSPSSRRRTPHPAPLPDPLPFLLPAPSTPFATSHRGRSYQSAIFYGECRLNGVTEYDASEAAREAGERHRRWWVQRAARSRRGGSSLGSSAGSGRGIDEASGDDEEEDEDEDDDSDDGEGGGGVGGVGRSKRPRRRSVRRGRRGRRGGGSGLGGTAEDLLRSLVPPPPPSPPPPSPPPPPPPPPPPSPRRDEIEGAKSALLDALRGGGGGGGCPTADAVSLAVGRLADLYRWDGTDARLALTGRSSPPSKSAKAETATMEGTWLALSRPEYENCLGTNDSGDFLYTLGRMSFDMFRPTGLVCSVRGIFNAVGRVQDDDDGGRGGGDGPEYVPYSLRGEVAGDGGGGTIDGLRTYNIVVAFTVEPNQNRNGHPDYDHGDYDAEDRSRTTSSSSYRSRSYSRADSAASSQVVTRPLRGVMTNYGYMLPDPNVPNRFSIWFTGGTLELDDSGDDDDDGDDDGVDSTYGDDGDGPLDEWRRIFDPRSAPRRSAAEFARVLAARVLLGARVTDEMDEDGTVSYELRRPIGGHGVAYVDALFLDGGMRVLRGHRDQIYVCARVESDARPTPTNTTTTTTTTTTATTTDDANVGGVDGSLGSRTVG